MLEAGLFVLGFLCGAFMMFLIVILRSDKK